MTAFSGIRLCKVVRRKGDFCLEADGEFRPGVHLITGRVGSGKTTLGDILAGIETPDSGRVICAGCHRVMLMQDASYHISTMTVREEASSWHSDADRTISLAGLAGKEGKDIFSLSRGELRRLELAAILTGGYDVIVLDEPYAGLDQAARRLVSELIGTRKNRVVILISHDISCLPDIDILWEMHAGTLHRVGTVPDDLMNWSRPPPLIRYLRRHGMFPAGLSRHALEETACRMHGSD